jgi:hypothetical protein
MPRSLDVSNLFAQMFIGIFASLSFLPVITFMWEISCVLRLVFIRNFIISAVCRFSSSLSSRSLPFHALSSPSSSWNSACVCHPPTALFCPSLIVPAVSFLAIVLAASFFFTIPLTGVAVFTYLFARFFLHIRSDGREGVSHWIDETRRHFIQSDGPVLRERHDELDPFARKPTPTAKPATPVSSLKANHIVVEE